VFMFVNFSNISYCAAAVFVVDSCVYKHGQSLRFVFVGTKIYSV